MPQKWGIFPLPYVKGTIVELHGQEVHINKRHMKQHANVLPFLEEALTIASRQSLPNQPHTQAMIITVEFDRVVGDCDCVETSDSDTILYAIRRERDRHMRFVKGRGKMPEKRITMILFQQVGYWKLVSAWFGGQAAREPQDPNSSPEERAAAYDFWSKHALVWGCQRVREETITDVCPWPQL